MILQGKKARGLGLVSGYKFEEQFQPAGVDLSVQSVHEFSSAGIVDGDNSRRKLPECREISWPSEGALKLAPGVYKVVFNEVVSVPLGVAAIARTRSSLLRSGVSIQTAVWDPGYTGRSEAQLLVSNPHGFSLYKDARLIQLVFIRLEDAATEGYSGKYQGENIGPSKK